MTKLMRSASLDGFVPLARSLGLDPYRLIDQAGIPRACLTNSELKISSTAYCRLLDAAGSAAHADDFGVRLAESRQLSTFGPVGLVMREQPTVRRAIAALVEHIRLHNESAFLELEEMDDVVIVKPRLEVALSVPLQQGKGMILGVMCRILTLLLGPSWRPESVCFVSAPPQSLASHWRVFGRKLEFNQAFSGIVCLRRDIDRSIAGSDPGLAREAERYVELLAPRRQSTARETVRAIVLTLLPIGQCTVERVSQHLGVNRRTLHRQLSVQKTTFSALVDSVRAELSVSYVEESDRSFASIAELLGFAAQSSFAHWHNSRFGMSASARREGSGRGLERTR